MDPQYLQFHILGLYMVLPDDRSLRPEKFEATVVRVTYSQFVKNMDVSCLFTCHVDIYTYNFIYSCTEHAVFLKVCLYYFCKDQTQLHYTKLKILNCNTNV
jgi:hypothetical protein